MLLSWVSWNKYAWDCKIGELFIRLFGQLIFISCRHMSNQNILLWVSVWEIRSDSILCSKMQPEACSISLVNKPSLSMHLISWLLTPWFKRWIEELPSLNCPQCHGSAAEIEYWPLEIIRLFEKFSLMAQLIFASIESLKTICACDWRSTPVSSIWPVADMLFGSAKDRPCKWPAINLAIVNG